MIRSLATRASAALASVAMAFAFVSSPVHAASVTLSVAPCDSFSLTGNPPNQTLTCVVSNAPSGCSIQGPTSGTVNNPITLTAVCSTGVPNAWAWTGGHCQGVTTQSCTGTEANVGNVTYNVVASNGIGPAPQASTTVSWTNTPPLAPSGCTLAAVPSSLPAGGGTTVLTATCSGGGAPTSYAWTGGTLTLTTATPTQSTSLTQTTTYTVTPSNAGGNGNTAQVMVNVGQVVQGFCGQYQTVLPIVNATWGQQGSWHSADSGNFGDNAVWVFKLTVPPGTPNSLTTGTFTTAEYGGPNTPRQLTISTQACDFRQRDYLGNNGPLSACNDGTTCQIYYAVQTPQLFGGVAGLTAGQTYYINVRNFSNYPTPAYDCGLTSCNAIMNHAPASP